MERLLEKVDKHGPISAHAPTLGRCWIWTGSLSGNGYPRLYYNGRPVAAYRVAYIETIGDIPAGLHLDHICRVICCVNPGHLEPVTQAENNRRQKAALTQCPHGHAYPENAGYRMNTHKDGTSYRHRYCLECNRGRMRYSRSGT